MKKKKIIITLIIALLITSALWVIWADTALQLNTYAVYSSSIPKSFDGYRIAHISDLHNTEIGKNNETLLEMIAEADPDIIAITGDMIDSRNTNVEVALQFAEKAVEIAPCYYVCGNHESRVSEYEDLKIGLIERGVAVLENTVAEIERGDEKIMLIGVVDPTFDLSANAETVMEKNLNEYADIGDFKLLLSHRPELFDVYVKNNMNLVLSGHAHGGQFRLPFIGGMYAPAQGLFPEYYEGSYKSENTEMIVSRGIGNSIIPIRFNNRPEVILIELKYQY